MTALLIKICGLKTADALDAALDAGADMVGFVFFAPSPRHVDAAGARALGLQVSGAAKKVALLVDPADADLAAAIDALKPDLLQLHGAETPARVRAIRDRFGLPVIKAIAVAAAADVAAAKPYLDVADHILFDARAPREATRPGGLGKSFDWHLLEAASFPFILSGGLGLGNVADAIRIARPAGVDVSSGVERATGEKDPDKIRAFIRAARLASSAPHPGDHRAASAARPG